MVSKISVILCILLFTSSCTSVIAASELELGANSDSQLLAVEPSALPTIIIQSFPALPSRNHPQLVGVTPQNSAYEIGRSEEGRPIVLWRFGYGAHLISLIGGIHGRYEENTVDLSNALISFFANNPDAVYPGVTLDIIPVANPDGYALENRLEGRFNSNGVDLNRNWGCDWSVKAYFHDSLVNPGSAPMSETETRVIADYALMERPAAVIFYHSAANGIFSGGCDGVFSPTFLAETISSGTGYPAGSFSSYPVNGDASNWMVQQGIPSIIVELETATSPEYDQNLSGIMALQCYYARQDFELGAIIEGLPGYLNEHCSGEE